MKFKSLVAVAVSALALAGCAVDNSGSDADKETIRIGYQSFPSGDLIVKNNKWLEEALPDFNIKWIKFDSGPMSTPPSSPRNSTSVHWVPARWRAACQRR